MARDPLNDKEPIFSLPNLLTLVRLPMAVAAWVVAQWPWALFGLMLAAAASDMLDGWFARRMRARRLAAGGQTRLAGPQGRGAWLDPACDKTFVLSVIGATWLYYAPPWWLLLMISAREILLVPLVLIWRALPHKPLDLRAGAAGKLATVAQFCALWSILLESDWQLGLAMLSALIGVLAVADYLRRALAESSASSS